MFFDNAVESIGDSVLRISTVLSDQDQWTTFGPDKVAKLQRESDQVYSDVCVNYADGTLKLYRSRPSTYATYVRRSTQIDRPYTRSVATATLQAEAFLDKHSVETDRVTCIIRVPAARVGLIQAGQRVQFKAPHMPSYDAFTWMRVVMCTPKPADETVSLYDIALELVGIPGTVEEGCDCLPGDDGTITTGVLALSDRIGRVGPIHVPAHCSMTITKFDWTGYVTVGQVPPYRIGATFLDEEDNNLCAGMFETFGGNAKGIKVTPGADLGNDYRWPKAGAGFNTDSGQGDVYPGWADGTAVFGMKIENESDVDFPFDLQYGQNPFFESSGTWSITATYTCGDAPVADDVTDLGPHLPLLLPGPPRIRPIRRWMMTRRRAMASAQSG